MKLAKGFVLHNTGDEHILVSAGADGFSGLVRMNEIAAFLVEKLKESTTEEGLVEAVLAEYEVEKERAAADVRAVVEKLRSIGAIEA